MFARFAGASRPAMAVSCNAWRRGPPRFPRHARMSWLSSPRNNPKYTQAAKREDQLDQAHRQSEVAERHHDLVRGMPVQLCELIEAVEKIEHEKDYAKQLDAAAEKTG